MIINFVNDPSQGYDYLFVSIDEIKQDALLNDLGKNYAIRKLSFMKVDNAYNINMKRVENLSKDGHYAVTLVFLVSAFENIMKDLFFLYHDIWFILDDNDFDDEIYEKFGTIIDPRIKKSFVPKYYVKTKVIGGNRIGINQTEIEKAKKWRNLRYWENIHTICKNLRVNNEYILKKQGNNGMEIGKFEILKEILERKAREMKILNFQKISGKKGIKKSFETFYNMNLKGFDDTFANLEKYIKIRHKIIHGTLEDNQIDGNMIFDFKSRMLKLVSYIREDLSTKYRDNISFGFN